MMELLGALRLALKKKKKDLRGPLLGWRGSRPT